MQNNNYVFFSSGNSPFSNWHKRDFELYDQKFNCGEQAMMWSKAMIFGDRDVAEKIMQETDPQKQKMLGKEVGGFNQTAWDAMKTRVVYNVIKGKFSDTKMWRHLELTEGKKMVEASPYDGIWGIKLKEDTAKNIPESEWPGQNLLGKMLTKYRSDRLKKQIPDMSLNDIMNIGINALKQEEKKRIKDKSRRRERETSYSP